MRFSIRLPPLHCQVAVLADLVEYEQGEQGHHGQHRGHGGGDAVVAPDDLGVDGHCQGLSLAGIQQDSGGQLADERDPAEDGAGQNAGGHHGQCDGKERLGLGAAQRQGRLLHIQRYLLQNGHGGADGVGQAAHHQRHHHDEHAAGEHQRFPVKGGDHGNADDGARDDIGDHGDHVHRAGQHIPAAHRHIGDQHGQEHHDQQAHRRDDDGVLDTPAQTGEHVLIALKRVAGHIDLAAGLQERGVHHIQLRQDGDADDYIGDKMHDKVGKAVELLLFDAVQGVHGEGLLLRHKVLGEVHHHGDENRDDSDGGGEALVLGHLAHEFVVKNDGEGTVALSDQHRSSEVAHGADEHQQRAGQHGR